MPLHRNTAVIGCAIMAPVTTDKWSLEEIRYEVRLKVGSRVTTRDADKRIGDVLDFCFEPDAT